MEQYELKELVQKTKIIRRNIVTMSYKACSSHVGSALSMIDVLTVLYYKILNVSPETYKDKNRDKFILSKGHASLGLYAVLAERGYIKQKILDTYYKDGSCLSGHPKKHALPGIEASTGSLGHGLALGCGIALSDKVSNSACKTVVFMGDGECNEGSVWESAMFAASKSLSNLIAIVDNNNLQGLGRVDEVTALYSLSKKWSAFNWNVIEIDGHDFDEIYSSLRRAYESKDKPTMIIAHTIKGKGVSFMEDKLEWHYKSPNKEQYELAIKELT